MTLKHLNTGYYVDLIAVLTHINY